MTNRNLRPGGTTAQAIVGGLLIMVAVLTVALLAGRTTRAYGDHGTGDFIEYWAAFRVAATGGNPYDPAQLAVIEQQAGRPEAAPLMMWNPPWLLLLMRPVLQAPFGQAATLWLGVNVFTVAVSTVLITLGYRLTRFKAENLAPAVLGGVLSVPLAISIGLGQVSPLLLLAVALLYWALRTGHDATAGIALTLLSVKPHLFLLVVVLVAVIILREHRWRIAGTALVALAVLVISTTLLSPTLLADWWTSLASPPPGAPAPVAWRTPNIPNLVREVLAGRNGVPPVWPLTILPALAVASCAFVLWRVSRGRRIEDLLPPVLCLSVAMAPFGWTFDHVVLTVPQVIVFVRAFSDVVGTLSRALLLGASIGCHVALVLQTQRAGGADYFSFWWFPLAMLATWSLSQWMSLSKK